MPQNFSIILVLGDLVLCIHKIRHGPLYFAHRELPIDNWATHSELPSETIHMQKDYLFDCLVQKSH